jgi:hypothetical protein
MARKAKIKGTNQALVQSNCGDDDFEREFQQFCRKGRTLPESRRVQEILQQEQSMLRTGLPAVDDMLRGGFPCKSVRWVLDRCSLCCDANADERGRSEVFGEAGSGKTQIILHVRAPLPMRQCRIANTARDSVMGCGCSFSSARNCPRSVEGLDEKR